MNQYDTFLKLHNTYERKALRMLLKEFQALGKKIPYEVITPENAESLIRLTLNEAGLEKALFKVHLTIGKSYGNLEARRYRKYKRQKYTKNAEIEQEITQEENNTDEEWLLLLLLSLRNHNREFGGVTAALIADTYVATIIAEIAKLASVSLQEMRKRLMKIVNKSNFYKWQALRIARTETTFAMNQAAQISGEVSGVVMEKVWITSIDGREREIHRYANGQAVPLDGFFIVGGEKMKFPGDWLNGASAKNLVNCRCACGNRAKRDANGELIFID